MSVSWKSFGTALSAAVVLVMGVDYVTFAATGDSLILGRTNASQHATTLDVSGPGPALVLGSRGNTKPSLRVSSDAKVRRLNADRLDGLQASQLSTRAVTYQVGKRGDVLPGVGVWSIKTPPGLYQVTFKVLASPDSSPGLVSGMICGVLDLDTLGPHTRVYTADSGNALDGGTGIPIAMSGADMVRIRSTANPGVYCGTNGPDFMLFKASVSLTPINARRLKTARPVPAPFGKRLGGLTVW